MVEKHFDRDLKNYQEKVSRDLEICARYFKNDRNIAKTAEEMGISRITATKVLHERLDEKNDVLMVDIRPIKISKK